MQKKFEKIRLALAFTALACLAGMGCGDHGATLNADQKKTFDNAPAEIKQSWDKALAADHADDYVTAAGLLDDLNKATLSDSQRQALNTERASFGDRLMRAADANNANAIQALKNSQKIQHR